METAKGAPVIADHVLIDYLRRSQHVVEDNFHHTCSIWIASPDTMKSQYQHTTWCNDRTTTITKLRYADGTSKMT